MIVGTSHFVTFEKACRYYAGYGYSKADVRKLVNTGEIHIGAPRVKPGERLVFVDKAIDAPKQYTATKFVQIVGSTEYRIFQCKETGELTMFNRDYLALFLLDQADGVLWGSLPTSAFRDTEDAEDMSVIVMPSRMDLAHVESIFGKAIETFTKEKTECENTAI